MKIIAKQYGNQEYDFIESTLEEYETMRTILERNGVAVHLAMTIGNECRWHIFNPYKGIVYKTKSAIV